MIRLRLALAGLALALSLPVALLVARALESVELERRVGHEAVAARTFDEMESELSRFLLGEEERAFADYARADDPPAEPFALARFQLDPDGALHLAAGGGDVDRLAAGVRGAWPAPGAPSTEEAARSRPDRAVADALVPQAESAAAQAPGTTVALSGDDAGRTLGQAEGRTAAGAAESKSRATAYEVLGRLNRAAEERSQRQAAKREAPPRPAVAPAAPAGGPAPTRSLPEALRGEVLSQSVTELERSPEPLRDRAADAAAAAAAAAPRPAEREPFIARPAGDGRLVLYRTVLRPDGGYRQGVLVDLARLGDWLDARVVRASGLAGLARAEFLPLAHAAAPPARGVRLYQHRFAEPFDALAVRLALESLPGVGDATPVWGLAALVAVVGAVGLFALHRMVSVVVHFAERRQSFVAAVSHELKTPLTAIRMYAEMLRDGLVDSDDKRDRYYRTLTDESERLSRLVDNVLEFSRLERGSREMTFVVGPVGPVLEEAAQRLRPHAESEGFRLRVEVEPDLPPLRFDRDALLQILFNLVDNALKYASSAERREILLEARRHADGRRVMVAVRDFGPGVARRHRARVFEPFYRGQDELTRSARGTGIGLALVKELGERMGATVSGETGERGGFRVGLAFESAGPGPGQP